MLSKKIPVSVLAATGSVGQRFIQLLDGHPWFEVTEVTGSDRSVGQKYGTACRWLLNDPMPEWAKDLVVQPTEPRGLTSRIAFSALPADIAKDVEPAFAASGVWVCSNASAYRRESDVPILLPEVNPDHLNLLNQQKHNHGWKSGIITNPNCTSTGMTVALKALQQRFGLRKVFAVSMQAISGAGYPGVPSMDIIDNVIPYIGGEEDKVEWEPRKMLGSVKESGLELAPLVISAHTNRVAVVDGHTVCLSIEFDQPVSANEATKALREFQAPEVSRNLPSSPLPVIIVRDEENRPQPRLDRGAGRGMATVVGRVRPDPLFHLKFVVVSHNTIRGAAGGSIFNAELLVQSGYLD